MTSRAGVLLVSGQGMIKGHLVSLVLRLGFTKLFLVCCGLCCLGGGDNSDQGTCHMSSVKTTARKVGEPPPVPTEASTLPAREARRPSAWLHQLTQEDRALLN